MGNKDRNFLEHTILGLACLLALIMLLSIAAALSWAGEPEQVTVYGGRADGSPWYVVMAIVAAPGLAAMLLTITSGVMVKRINRSIGNPPLSVLSSIKWTLAFGALWGPLVSWGFGELVYSLTAVATSWKAIAVSPFITGVASMVAYDMLRWYTQKRYPGIYGLLSVKHRKMEGDDDNAGDLTFYAAQGNDDTIPRD